MPEHARRLWHLLRHRLLLPSNQLGEVPSDLQIERERVRQSLAVYECEQVDGGGNSEDDNSALQHLVYWLTDRVSVRICRRVCGSVGRADMELAARIRIDSTALASIWPAEQALTAVCLEQAPRFRARRVLELGAGQAGLAGLALAVLAACKHVCITDGHPTAVKLLRRNIELNRAALSAPVVCEQVLWHDPATYTTLGQFERIIVADCMFFEQYHEALLQCFANLLSDDGVVMYVGPARCGTLARFRERLQRSGVFQWSEMQLESVPVLAQLHRRVRAAPFYSADWHLPRIIEITRK